MISPSMNALHAYARNTGNSISSIRLLIESAIALYEDNASGLYKLAMTTRKPDMAIAFNTIGVALYDFRQQISKMQNKHFTETS